METICKKCQILFSGQNKKSINLSSAELAQRVVKVNVAEKCLLNSKQVGLGLECCSGRCFSILRIRKTS